MSDLFAQAVQASQVGDHAKAESLLATLVTVEPTHEAGWLWLATLLLSEGERRYCVDQALLVNPHSDAARAALIPLIRAAPTKPVVLGGTPPLKEASVVIQQPVQTIPQTATQTPIAPTVLTMEQRTALLEEEVQKYIGWGYRVISRTETTAQLVKPKQFSCLLAALLLIIMVLPFILYLLFYVAAKDETVYLTVAQDGTISRR